MFDLAILLSPGNNSSNMIAFTIHLVKLNSAVKRAEVCQHKLVFATEPWRIWRTFCNHCNLLKWLCILLKHTRSEHNFIESTRTTKPNCHSQNKVFISFHATPIPWVTNCPPSSPFPACQLCVCDTNYQWCLSFRCTHTICLSNLGQALFEIMHIKFLSVVPDSLRNSLFILAISGLLISFEAVILTWDRYMCKILAAAPMCDADKVNWINKVRV